MVDTFTLERGGSPLLISVPHAGTRIPRAMRRALTSVARETPDTDWYVDRLYDFARERGAGLLVARFSRYVVDLNRPPDDHPLYETRTSGLVPLETFGGEPLYPRGAQPDRSEIQDRLERYWRPYHAALSDELRRLRNRHGHAVLLDAHSIRSELPRLFDGRLPDLNLGSFSGASAAPALVNAAMAALRSAADASLVLDGRFKGGFITRHHGCPEEHVHALQLEVSQAYYMQESPPRYDPRRARSARAVLSGLIASLRDWTP